MADTGVMERRERWFADGAAALRRTLSAIGMAESLPHGEFYACPLCLTAYGRDAFEHGVFSDEHVPPRSTGSRVLVLTCTRCNSTAGTAMDADASGHEAMHDFLAGRSLSRDLRAEYKIGDITVRGNVTSVNGAIMMSVVPKANNPEDVTEMTETLTKWADAVPVGARPAPARSGTGAGLRRRPISAVSGPLSRSSAHWLGRG